MMRLKCSFEIEILNFSSKILVLLRGSVFRAIDVSRIRESRIFNHSNLEISKFSILGNNFGGIIDVGFFKFIN